VKCYVSKEFSSLLLKSSVSRDPSENWICWIGAQ